MNILFPSVDYYKLTFNPKVPLTGIDLIENGKTYGDDDDVKDNQQIITVMR